MDEIFQVGNCFQVSDNLIDKYIDNINGNIYKIIKTNNEDNYVSVLRWQGNDCNICNFPSLNCWSVNLANHVVDTFYNPKLVESPDNGMWKNEVFWIKNLETGAPLSGATSESGDDILKIKNVEYKVGDCCKITLHDKAKAIYKKMNKTTYNGKIIEFVKSEKIPSEMDYVVFILFEPGKLSNTEHKIAISLMAIVNHDFIAK
jgi:hypothetical protein